MIGSRMAIGWKTVQPLAKATANPGGGIYLRSDDGEILVFARRWRSGQPGDRRYTNFFFAVDYSTGSPVSIGKETVNLVRLKSQVDAHRASQD